MDPVNLTADDPVIHIDDMCSSLRLSDSASLFKECIIHANHLDGPADPPSVTRAHRRSKEGTKLKGRHAGADFLNFRQFVVIIWDFCGRDLYGLIDLFIQLLPDEDYDDGVPAKDLEHALKFIHRKKSHAQIQGIVQQIPGHDDRLGIPLKEFREYMEETIT